MGTLPGPVYISPPGLAGAPPSPPSRKVFLTVAVAVIVILILIVAFITHVLLGAPHTTPVNTVSQGTHPSTNSSNSPTPSVAPSSTASAHAGATPTPVAIEQADVSAWRTQQTPIISHLSNDLQAIVNGGKANSQSEVLSGCQALSRDVQTAQKAPAIPDPALQKYWTSALSDYASGSSQCVAAIDDQDSSLLTQSVTTLREGGTQVTDLSSAITALNNES